MSRNGFNYKAIEKIKARLCRYLTSILTNFHFTKTIHSFFSIKTNYTFSNEEKERYRRIIDQFL